MNEIEGKSLMTQFCKYLKRALNISFMLSVLVVNAYADKQREGDESIITWSAEGDIVADFKMVGDMLQSGTSGKTINEAIFKLLTRYQTQLKASYADDATLLGFIIPKQIPKVPQKYTYSLVNGIVYSFSRQAIAPYQDQIWSMCISLRDSGPLLKVIEKTSYPTDMLTERLMECSLYPNDYAVHAVLLSLGHKESQLVLKQGWVEFSGEFPVYKQFLDGARYLVQDPEMVYFLLRRAENKNDEALLLDRTIGMPGSKAYAALQILELGFLSVPITISSFPQGTQPLLFPTIRCMALLECTLIFVIQIALL